MACLFEIATYLIGVLMFPVKTEIGPIFGQMNNRMQLGARTRETRRQCFCASNSLK